MKLISLNEVKETIIKIYMGGDIDLAKKYKQDEVISQFVDNLEPTVKPKDAIRSKRNGYTRFETMMFLSAYECFLIDFNDHLIKTQIGVMRTQAYKYFQNPPYPKCLWMVRTRLLTYFEQNEKEVFEHVKSERFNVSVLVDLADLWRDVEFAFKD